LPDATGNTCLSKQQYWNSDHPGRPKLMDLKSRESQAKIEAYLVILVYVMLKILTKIEEPDLKKEMKKHTTLASSTSYHFAT
jgi:hypothetical protein